MRLITSLIRTALMVACLALIAVACGNDSGESSSGDGADDATAADGPTDDSSDDGDSAGDAGAESGGQDDGADAGGEVAQGGTLTVAGGAEPTGFDPIFTSGGSVTGGTEMMALYDTVMRYDFESRTMHPVTAESLEPNEDATVWTLKLKPDITFSDGTAYDAEAVKVNIERALSEESRIFAKSLLQFVEETTVVDPLTVEFQLSQAWGGFPFLFTTTVGALVSPKAIAERPDDITSNPVDVGAGPFILDSYKPNDSISFKRNPTYWGGDVPLDGVTIVWPGDDEIAFEGLQSGQFDVALLRNPAVAQRARDADLSTLTSYTNSGLTLQPNHGRGDPVTTDLRIRQAVAAAIDPEQMNSRVFNDQGLVGAGVIHESSPLYSGHGGTPYDPERARELVEEVKATTDWDGEIHFVCDTSRATMTQAIQAMLEAVGFSVNVTADIDTATLVNQVYVQADYDLACFGIQVEEVAPLSSLLGNFSSASSDARFGYESAEMDEALAALREAVTEDETKAALSDVLQIMDDDVATIPLAAVAETTAWREAVHDVRTNRLSVMMFGQAWIEE